MYINFETFIGTQIKITIPPINNVVLQMLEVAQKCTQFILGPTTQAQNNVISTLGLTHSLELTSTSTHA
jgi:hypothetical protein